MQNRLWLNKSVNWWLIFARFGLVMACQFDKKPNKLLLPQAALACCTAHFWPLVWLFPPDIVPPLVRFGTADPGCQRLRMVPSHGWGWGWSAGVELVTFVVSITLPTPSSHSSAVAFSTLLLLINPLFSVACEFLSHPWPVLV
ncbi:hypothetical protein [Aeromonas veronii]|uniref:hypothetical protein n=1 Tax=Aeromonas veronii TaxID=654 RepID=UPI0024450894|nr:hypothetical protein [Aeromonas veronii]